MKNEEKLKEILLSGTPMLFLGAGFSYESTNDFGKIPTGRKLKEELYDEFVKGKVAQEDEKEIMNYNLQEICQCIDVNLEKRVELRKFLIKRLSNVVPAEFHYKLSSYPWKKIYTVNIDDLVERIYSRSDTKLVIQNTAKEKKVKDEIEYVKLHGCVNEPEEAFVFSKKEYNELISSKINFKLNSLISDIQKENFIFVGASLTESDIDFYISQYENAGYFRKGTLIFIDPNPSIMLRGRVKELDGIIIEWTTENFLKFVESINFQQNEIEKQKTRLNYSGIFLYKDIIKSIQRKEVYESRLYEGYNCNWKDLNDGWIFENPQMKDIENEINAINWNNTSCYTIALYGNSFVGKDCVLKQIGFFLSKREFEVLEFKGKNLDIDVLAEYINAFSSKKFAILIENASYYYKQIEKLYQKNLQLNSLLIVTTSRNYYHIKKKYYLMGNPFTEFEITEKIDRFYADIIYKKLKEKGYLGHLSVVEEDGIREIMSHKNLVNLFTVLTYGSGFKKKISKTANAIFEASEQIKKLYIELALFDKADLPYYPSELLAARYSIDFNIYVKKDFQSLSPEQAMIVDFVRLDEEGVILRNKMLVDQIWNSLSENEKVGSILDILHCIAPYISENTNNYWRIIFESLLKEDCLEDKFMISNSSSLKLYYQVKKDFEGISYFWLQLGIAEQKNRDYEKALNHLNMAMNIRPKAYQIQHAIARNYLRHANCVKDFVTSQALFQEGEKLMLAMIKSQEFNKAKARNFTIHCYILEKINYFKHWKIVANKEELLSMKRYIDMIQDANDDYMDGLINTYVNLLVELKMVDILHMKPGDKYFKAYGKKYIKTYTNDILVDSY